VYPEDNSELNMACFIALLDDLDKELNNYVMRCREWYGWHFPELGKIITDHTVFARTVKALGNLHEEAI
jgi:nucleolar protein 58